MFVRFLAGGREAKRRSSQAMRLSKVNDVLAKAGIKSPVHSGSIRAE